MIDHCTKDRRAWIRAGCPDTYAVITMTFGEFIAVSIGAGIFFAFSVGAIIHSLTTVIYI